MVVSVFVVIEVVVLVVVVVVVVVMQAATFSFSVLSTAYGFLQSSAPELADSISSSLKCLKHAHLEARPSIHQNCARQHACFDLCV